MTASSDRMSRVEHFRKLERDAIAARWPDQNAAQVQNLADVLWRVEENWDREGSGPGSRFEGQRREVVQAVAALQSIEHRAAATS